MNNKLEKIIALAKRRGFIYPGSEIYGGLANTYDLGPLGTELKRNLINFWWQRFVSQREEVYGIDTSILTPAKVWEVSGHTKNFTDILIDCRTCGFRTRADHLIEEGDSQIKAEGKKISEIAEIINKRKISCPQCCSFNWTKPRYFNLLFKTEVGIISKRKNQVYLRGETAQGMFINFKQIKDCFHPSLPFGLAQVGKVFRNEITLGKFTFRVLEFDLAEIEYFIKKQEWNKWFKYWQEEIYRFALDLGAKKEKLRWRPHNKEELAHYSLRTEDLEYQYPFGYKEWFACAYRTDFDLKNHMENSKVDMTYTDSNTQEKFIPHVIEPTFGITRTLTTLLINGYYEETIKGQKRIVLKLKPWLAPYTVAVFPLLANKPQLVNLARKVFINLSQNFSVFWDDRGNIGKRYYSQDEIGTPWCITIDFDSLKKDDVTIRDRDTTKQERVKISQLYKYLNNKLKK